MPDRRAADIAEIVESALERERAEWPAFLDEVCGTNIELREEVESLLNFHDRAPAFFDQPAVHHAADILADDETLPPGHLIAEYEIISLIGTGGMGEVYMANDTNLGRKVALKLVKQGLGTATIIRHFRQEERILAGLNDPNIARLYGAGVTPAGVPYFVMEYVEGERLDEYCHGRGLTIAQRLNIFRKVCAAVSYAHQHLVIHRDLKPANVRVTADGEPKLLDFGIAKLLDPETQLGEQTITLGAVMTPEYASPEQVRGETMTTASDVYSLGVLLYELLTGQKPYRITSRQPAEIARAITDHPPTRPSSAAATDARSSARSRHFLRGDLDNIVLMALRKEPARRYASVAQFSDDIRRHLEGRPVLARKDTFAYRAGKFIQRNKVGLAAAALVFFSLAGGIIATSYEARRAQHRFDDVRHLANSLMFEIHDSVQNLQGSTPTRRLIVDRALQYLDSLSRESGRDAALQRELATAYEKVADIQGNPYSANLGDTEGALTSYRKALAIREKFAAKNTSVESAVELGRSFRGLGDVLEQKGDVAQTIENYRHSLLIFEQLAASHPNDFAVQDELARAYETLGEGLARTERKDERAAAYRKTLEIRRRLLASNPTDAKLRRRAALAFLKVGSVAIPEKAEALDNLRLGTELLEALSAEHPDDARARREVGMAYYFTGTALTEAGDYAAALEARRKAFAIRQEIASADPTNKQAQFDLAVGYGDLCEAYTRTGSSSEAFNQGEHSLAILRGLAASDPTNAVYERNLGLCYERLADAKARAAADEQSAAQWGEARAWYQKALDLFASLGQRGTLMPSDAGEVAKFKAKLAAADDASAQSQR